MKRAVPAFWAFVLVTWGTAAWLGARRPEPDVYPFLKKAWPGASYAALGDGRFRVTRGGALLGFAATGSDYGYGGSMTLAVAAGPDWQLHSLAVLEYRDTPDLFTRAKGLLPRLVGKGVGDAFRVGEDVDAVSGATASSRGLALAALAGARRIAERLPGAGQGGTAPDLGGPELALGALLLLALLGRGRTPLGPRPRRALRITAWLAGLGLLGLLLARPWVIAFPVRLAAGDVPAWRTHVYWYGLLAVALLAEGRSGKSPYCPWMCPFGAAQDLAGLATGAHRRRLRAGALFAWVKRLLLWLAVLLGLLFHSPGGASYEIFATLFRWTGSPWQFAVLFFVAAAALVARRPFCHWACPVDAAEQALRPVRRALLSRAGLRPRVALPVAPAAPVTRRLDEIERFRGRALAAVGLFCAGLLVGHLAERFSAQAAVARENLLSETFTTRARP